MKKNRETWRDYPGDWPVGLTRRNDRGGKFYYERQFRGKRYQFSLEAETLRVAMNKCRKLNETLEEEGTLEKFVRITFEEAVEHFLATKTEQDQRTITRLKQYFANQKEFLEENHPEVLDNLKLLTTKMCQDYMSWRLEPRKLRNGQVAKERLARKRDEKNRKQPKGASVTTTNNERGCFSTWFDYLMDNYEGLKLNPWKKCKRIELSRKAKARKKKEKQWMTSVQVKALLREALIRDQLSNRGHQGGRTFHDAICTATKTGFRISELINLEWQDIRWDARRIDVIDYRKDEFGERGSKGFKARSVPMSTELKKLLLERKRSATSRFVFPHPKDGISPMGEDYFRKNYKRMTDRAGFPHITETHAMRRTFATLLRQSGARLEIIQGLLGHESINQTARDYSFPSEDEGSDEIDMMDDLF